MSCTAASGEEGLNEGFACYGKAVYPWLPQLRDYSKVQRYNLAAS